MGFKKGMGIIMKNILCYGDSNTHGTVPIDFDIMEKASVLSDFRLPYEKRWTGILQKELGNSYLVIEEGLNGRTTVWDDPVEGLHKNGFKYLVPCLESHAPLDLVLLMLGTNDLKTRFSVSAYDISLSIGVLVRTIQASGSGPGGKAPQVLIMSPAPIGRLTHLAGLFSNGVEESYKLAGYYKKIAKLYGCHFFDVGKLIKTSDLDGLHFCESDIAKLGKELAKVVKTIL